MNSKENVIKNIIIEAQSTNQMIMLITSGGVISGAILASPMSDTAHDVFVSLKDVVFRNGNLKMDMNYLTVFYDDIVGITLLK